jgi:tRNA dimethylallyltransferase
VSHLPPQPVVVIAGPTGSGKSTLALQLASAFGGEIVNCDSLQIYRGLDIGTAKPSSTERAEVPHHLFDILEPEEVFNAGDYAALARPLLRQIVTSGRMPLVVGGTGFYLRALLDGLAPSPKRDDALRQRLQAREDRRPNFLHRLLTRLDPVAAARIHANDRNKLIRALEICILSRRPATHVFEQGRQPLEGLHVIRIGLQPDRALLHQRIAERTARMFATGLAGEVRGLLGRGVSPNAKAFESIGYKECLRLLAGEIDEPAAIELTCIATRQYAKRQLTWFRRESGFWWIADFGDSPQSFQAARLHILENTGKFTQESN